VSFFPGMVRRAEISPDGKYRYDLRREWSDRKPTLYFIMLNPSTADATLEDPTLRKCIGFAHRMDYGSVRLANLFAFRATRPSAMLKASDPIGPENDAKLRRFIRDCISTKGTLVCAWGAHAPAYREEAVKCLLREAEAKPQCFGRTKQGQPFHPLMLPWSAGLQSYPLFRGEEVTTYAPN